MVQKYRRFIVYCCYSFLVKEFDNRSWGWYQRRWASNEELVSYTEGKLCWSDNRMMLWYMLWQCPSHPCTKMQLHSADNQLRIKSLESLSKGSPNTLSTQFRYKFGTERYFAYRGMRKKVKLFRQFYQQSKTWLRHWQLTILRHWQFFSAFCASLGKLSFPNTSPRASFFATE